MTAGTISGKLAALGHTLGPARVPVANFVSTVRTGNLLLVSGQIAMHEGQAGHPGRLGDTLTIDEGYRSARDAALNVLSHIAAATGDRIAHVHRILRLGVFVASTDSFTAQPEVANGASDLMVAVFGDAGRHARAAVGVAALPLGASVEVEALVELEQGA